MNGIDMFGEKEKKPVDTIEKSINKPNQIYGFMFGCVGRRPRRKTEKEKNETFDF